MSARVDRGDQHDGAEVVDDGERHDENLQRHGTRVAEQREDPERESDVGGHRECRSPPGSACRH